MRRTPILYLRYLRLKNRWSQRYAADRAGFPQPTFCLIETGRLIPTDDQLERLGSAFGYTPAHVLLKEIPGEVVDRLMRGESVEA